MEIVHYPVMYREVLENLVPPNEDGTMIDATTGEGGHTSLFLEKYPKLSVIGLDRDSGIQEKAIKRLEKYKDRFTPVNTWFDDYLEKREGESADLVLFDLGISTYHYVESGRGFSFMKDEALDMRLDTTSSFDARYIVNNYDKESLASILYNFGEERYLTPGDDFYVAELDTARGSVRVGAMICYDREFPESARILMLKGAELILVPNACPMEINRLAQLRGRAFENMTAIATCNYPDTVPDCNGRSTVFDGVAYLPDGEGSRDTCILRAGGEEEICLAALDLERLRAYRASEVHGNAYRRPGRYGLLNERKIEPPFVRPDYRP